MAMISGTWEHHVVEIPYNPALPQALDGLAQDGWEVLSLSIVRRTFPQNATDTEAAVVLLRRHRLEEPTPIN